MNRPITLPTGKALPRLSGSRLVALLLFVFLAVVAPFGGAGCAPGTPLGPQVKVSENPEQALKDGEAKVKAGDDVCANDACKTGLKDEAKKNYTDAVTYYMVVANKYKGTATGLEATLEAARIQAELLPDQKQAAYASLRKAVRDYPAGSITNAALLEELHKQYQGVITALDAQNSNTYYYMVMDALMKISGNNAVLALFIVAVAVTLLTWPLRKMVLKQSKEMQRYMPEMKKIQEKYKDDMLVSQEKMQEFNKKHGINPLAGCLPALAQWPITLLMYQVIAHYQFHFTTHYFLWINKDFGAASLNWPSPFKGTVAPNLAESDLILMLLYVVSMFLQMRFTPQSSPDPQAVATQQQMAITMPLVFFFVMWNSQWASAFVLYWFMSNLLTLGQQWIINKQLPKVEPLILDEKGEPVKGSTPGPTTLAPNTKLISPKNRKK